MIKQTCTSNHWAYKMVLTKSFLSFHGSSSASILTGRVGKLKYENTFVA